MDESQAAWGRLLAQETEEIQEGRMRLAARQEGEGKKMNVQVASASILGRDHVAPGKNNQDAVWVQQDGETTVAVVCDGCGSGAHSEVGAKIGARLVANELCWHIASGRWPFGGGTIARCDVDVQTAINTMLKRVQDDVLAQLRVLANSMGGSLTTTVQDYLLFTVVGAAVTHELAFVFGCGDGVGILNGLDLRLGLTDGTNAPPYLGYELVGQSRDALRMKGVVRAAEFSNLLIASDGLEAISDDPSKKIPGKDQEIGFPSQFWKDDKFFKNSDALRRFLALANRSTEAFDWKAQVVNREHGIFKDDTSVVVVRKTP